MRDLKPLIPGFYTDTEGLLYLNMREFLTIHGLPDVPEMRKVAWSDIRDIFGDVPVLEISD